MSVFTGSNRRFGIKGEIEGRAWWRGEGDRVDYVAAAERTEPLAPGHPAAYEASDELSNAVNTALLLRRPLLVTGNPGTGKTELAERIAYELDLGAVLRFDAQSLSESGDLFYRFDHIGQLVAAKLVESGRVGPDEAAPLRFVQWGPLGRAILRSDPSIADRLQDPSLRPPPVIAEDDSPTAADTPTAQPCQSVVLIDEIDKASRDFPNDLLNGLDRMEFRIRELGLQTIRGTDRDSPFHPVVVITSNSERDLPRPFLRRCIYFNIPDPGPDQLATIVHKRVFGTFTPQERLPELYRHLLDAFVHLRADTNMTYRVGTAELLDMATAAHRVGLDPQSRSPANIQKLTDLISTMAKDASDQKRISERLMYVRVSLSLG